MRPRLARAHAVAAAAVTVAAAPPATMAAGPRAPPSSSLLLPPAVAVRPGPVDGVDGWLEGVDTVALGAGAVVVAAVVDVAGAVNGGSVVDAAGRFVVVAGAGRPAAIARSSGRRANTLSPGHWVRLMSR